MSSPKWLQKLESSVATTERAIFSPILVIGVQLYSKFFWKKLLSLTIKLEKGGLKNLSKRTVDKDKNIKITHNSVIILVVLYAKFLITHTKYYLK